MNRVCKLSSQFKVCPKSFVCYVISFCNHVLPVKVFFFFLHSNHSCSTFQPVRNAEQVSEQSGERNDEEEFIGMTQMLEGSGQMMIPEPRGKKPKTNKVMHVIYFIYFSSV